ncbi:hypothetical protein M501DRAFT_999922 [Patellaria atrata CBS 101060]|uniref:Uncharacterized protein n=1 Tax=Patellaria atrata CBS 101060 TaxID=1346257 RepID=A0A9P4S2X3_9PEZI|nr:hypothetical protein M501DRAFT_999922 [Patellaria atrata CBS 101060]
MLRNGDSHREYNSCREMLSAYSLSILFWIPNVASRRLPNDSMHFRIIILSSSHDAVRRCEPAVASDSPVDVLYCTTSLRHVSRREHQYCNSSYIDTHSKNLEFLVMYTSIEIFSKLICFDTIPCYSISTHVKPTNQNSIPPLAHLVATIRQFMRDRVDGRRKSVEYSYNKKVNRETNGIPLFAIG